MFHSDEVQTPARNTQGSKQLEFCSVCIIVHLTYMSVCAVKVDKEDENVSMVWGSLEGNTPNLHPLANLANG